MRYDHPPRGVVTDLDVETSLQLVARLHLELGGRAPAVLVLTDGKAVTWPEGVTAVSRGALAPIMKALLEILGPPPD